MSIEKDLDVRNDLQYSTMIERIMARLPVSVLQAGDDTGEMRKVLKSEI
jgi:hypothetical protein